MSLEDLLAETKHACQTSHEKMYTLEKLASQGSLGVQVTLPNDIGTTFLHIK